MSSRRHQTLLDVGGIRSPWMLEIPPHRYHKHNAFNCGNAGCMVCGRAKHGAELRIYRYRTGSSETWDYEPFDDFHDWCGSYSVGTLAEAFAEDRGELMYGYDYRDSDDYDDDVRWWSELNEAPEWTDPLSDTFWRLHEGKQSWQNPPWDDHWDLQYYDGYRANLEAMLDPKADESKMYLEEDEEAA